MLYHHLSCLPIFVDVAVEGGFESEAVHNAKFAEENDSGGFELALFNAELAAVKPKHLRLLIEKLGENSAFEITLIMQRKAWSVHKGAFLATVAVNIDKRCYWVLLSRLIYYILH